MFRPLEAIIRSRFGYPGEEDGFGWLCYPKVTTPPYPLHFTNVLSQYTWKNEISVLQWPLSIPLATQTHLPLQDTRILTWWWPPEAETCRLIIKIPYISCNKLFSNSCLVFNLNYYKFVVFDVHTPLFSKLNHLWRRVLQIPPEISFSLWFLSFT